MNKIKTKNGKIERTFNEIEAFVWKIDEGDARTLVLEAEELWSVVELYHVH